MSPWLKPRLLALFCSALLVGGATTYLHAQENYGPPAKTPEEAALNFWKLLDFTRESSTFSPYGLDKTDFDGLKGSIVRAQFEGLTSPGSARASEKFFSLLATQASEPSFDTQIQSSGDKETVVSVAPSAVPKAREVVVVREEGGYRVDLVATYGRWNGLKGLEADKSLYKITGWSSPTLAQQGEFVGSETQTQCQSNLKQIGLAFAMYSQDYDERLPPARRWSEVVAPYLRSRQVFTCPAIVNRGNGYAYNSKLSQYPLAEVLSSAQTLQLYETSNTNPNVFAPFTGRAYRHTIDNEGTGMNICFADGHVKWFKKGSEQRLGLSPSEDYDGLPQ